MTIPDGGLPTGVPNLVWNKHPEIEFFYGTASKRYIYFLYRIDRHRWTWEVWTKPANPRILARRLLQTNDPKSQFHTAHAEANRVLQRYEENEND